MRDRTEILIEKNISRIIQRLIRSKKSRENYMRASESTIYDYFSGGDWLQMNLDMAYLLKILKKRELEKLN